MRAEIKKQDMERYRKMRVMKRLLRRMVLGAVSSFWQLLGLPALATKSKP